MQRCLLYPPTPEEVLRAVESVQFCLLGPLVVSGHDGAVDIRGPRSRQLLSRLLVDAGRPVDAGTLLLDVWGRSHNDADVVKTTVSRLRRDLAALDVPGNSPLRTSPNGYLLDVDRNNVDIHRFEQEIRAARARVDRAPAAAVDDFTVALSRWRGRPLQDVADLEFALPIVGRLDDMRLTALEDKAAALLRLGRAAEVVAEFESLALEHPLRESLTARLMVALFAVNRQVDALRTYRNLERALGEQLGVLPSTELRGLEASILRQDLDVTTALPGSNAAAATSRPWMLRRRASTDDDTPFVGRDQELSTLMNSVSTAMLGGGPTVVLVRGVAGIGKTRLANALLAAAFERDRLALYGRFDPEAVLPLQAFIEAIRPLITGPTPGLSESGRRSVETAIAEIAEVMPELRTATPTDLPTLDPSRRYRLFDSIAAVLRVATGEQGAVVVLDDAHWADAMSTALVRQLPRTLATSPLLFAVFTRDQVDPSPHGDASFVDALADWSNVATLDLHGLDHAAIAKLLIAAQWPEPDANEVAPEFARATAGNPFFLRELLAVADPVRRREQSLSDLDLPRGVEEVISRNLRAVPSDVRDTLEVAAVLGHDFEVDVLAAALAQPAPAVAARLDNAYRAGLLSEIDGATGHFEFRHDLLRRVLTSGLSDTRQFHLHVACADALERHREGAIFEIADHVVRAGSLVTPARLLSSCLRAADAAISVSAFELAVHWLDRARIVIDASIDDPEVRGGYLIRSGYVRAALGQIDEARSDFSTAIDIGRKIGSGEILADVAKARSLFGVPYTDREHEVAQLREALDLLAADDWSRRSRMCRRLAEERCYSPRPDQAEPYVDEALLTARQSGDTHLIGDALVARHLHLMMTGAPGADRLAAAQAAVDAVPRDGSTTSMTAHETLLAEALRFNTLDEFEVEATRYREDADRAQLPRHLWLARVLPATSALARGNLREAAELSEHAFAIGTAYGVEPAEGLHDVQDFVIRWQRDRLDDISDVLAWRAEHRFNGRVWRLVQLLAAAEAGRTDEVEQSLEGLLETRLSDVKLDWLALAVGAILSEIVYAARQGDVARSFRGMFESQLGQAITIPIATVTFGQADYHLGLLEATAGEHEAAVEHLRAAASASAHRGTRVWQGLAEAALASLLRSADGQPTPEAQQLAKSAHAIGRATGSALCVRRADEAIRS